MRRLTHLAVATLCVMPLAVDHSWPAASGIVVLGMAGSVMPDYLDLHSDVRGVLAHRGMSHGIFVAALLVVLASVIISALSRLDDSAWAIDAGLVSPLTLSFGIGIASHLLLDACTPHGIRPLLPVSGWRLRLLPKRLRIRTGSRIDDLIGLVAFAAAVTVLVFNVVPA